jgi:hypothetical protein
VTVRSAAQQFAQRKYRVAIICRASDHRSFEVLIRGVFFFAGNIFES